MVSGNDNSNSSNKQAAEAPKATNSPKDSQGTQPDEQQLKVISAVGYLGILFLLPYLMFPKEKFAVFHANQGLILLIFAVVLQIAMAILAPFTFGLSFLLSPIAWLATTALLVVGVINAFNGHMKRLPVIGKFDLLKVQG